jgi:catechol 2,3-dioxygenase-like lactoylglutathione lyase family enzyme
MTSTLRLSHYSIRTSDLETSRRFYEDVIGLRVGPRPPFRFPGLWLYDHDGHDAQALVHIIGEDAETDAYLGGRTGLQDGGTGRFDHIAFMATDRAGFKQRCIAMGVRYAENTVPALGLHQVFLRDPSGITIEMNYPAEDGAP